MPRGMPGFNPQAMNPGITFSWHPALKIQVSRQDNLVREIRSFREPLRRSVKDVLAPSFRKNFDVGGRPGWEPLAEGTILRKTGGQILVNTGALRSAAQQQNIWTMTPTSAEITGLPSRVSYGNVHQLGGRNRGGGLVPPRPFLVMQEEDERAIERVFYEWFVERALRTRAFGGPI